MSCNYADGLSPYSNKGKLGLAEKFDTAEDVNEKVKLLARWINESQHVVIHTGAGISTSAGIPDFRSPNGVWTLEAKGQKPNMDISFNDAEPTLTHMAIVKLVEAGKVHYVVSQNIDGLHLKSGLRRKYLAELHGNMFVMQCHQCLRQFVSNTATPSVGQKCLEKSCFGVRLNGRPCRGKLYDTILDWEHNLPENELAMADFHCCLADLSICLGTTLQIVPSGNLPLNTKKYNFGKLAICNLQPTKHDRKADLIIHSYVDEVMCRLLDALSLPIPKYDRSLNPIYSDLPMDWTVLESDVRIMRIAYESKCCRGRRKRKRTSDKRDAERCVKKETKVDEKCTAIDETELADNKKVHVGSMNFEVESKQILPDNGEHLESDNTTMIEMVD